MEGSRTGKAAEADLMVLIAKNPVVDGQEEEDTQRHLNVVKNKLSDGMVLSIANWNTRQRGTWYDRRNINRQHGQ